MLCQTECLYEQHWARKKTVLDRAVSSRMLYQTKLSQGECFSEQHCVNVSDVPYSVVLRWILVRSRTVLFTVTAVPACAVSRCVMSRTVLFTVNAVLDSAVSKYSKWCTEQQCFKVSDVPDCALARLMFYGTRLCQGKYCTGQRCANVSAVLDCNGV